MEDRYVADFAWPDRGSVLSIPGVEVWRTLDGRRARAYASGPSAGWARLSCLQELAGASVLQRAEVHYVVETDVAAEHEDDFNAWYESEHLPGLASVPGAVRARRYRRAVGTPRYLACYDLATQDALTHPAWLAVRQTDWSSHVRPTFLNPVRTMFVRATA